MIGQHILVLVRALGQHPEGLCFEDVNGVRVAVSVSREQSVNQHVLEFQTVPLVLFCDDIDEGTGYIRIPETSLISVLPVSSSAVEKIINAGEIDDWIAALRQDLL